MARISWRCEPLECIKEAVPDQPEPHSRHMLRADRVYQRGRSRPARAKSPPARRQRRSVSKRPFPTSQSPAQARSPLPPECIKEAVPDQPEPHRPELLQPERVYQRGRSRPARARRHDELGYNGSVSKRPFPTSQSISFGPASRPRECIKEAVPDQPEPPHRCIQQPY